MNMRIFLFIFVARIFFAEGFIVRNLRMSTDITNVVKNRFLLQKEGYNGLVNKIENKDVPNVDQTVNLNIMDYVNDTESKNKTIKEIYDDLTNDNRLVLQEDLDNLQTANFNDNFVIGEKYGATRFDTYSVN